jgi:uncharacterized protein (TIGR02996 family)
MPSMLSGAMARKPKSGEGPVLDATLPRMLMEAIAAAPHDDAPRLVAADWFEEHGQPERGELISVQCRLEKLGPADPEREPLLERMRELLSHIRPGWKPSIFNCEVGLVRGFPGSVVGDPSDLLAGARELAALTLPVDRVGLNHARSTPDLAALLASPFWAGVRVLHLDHLDDAVAPALLESGKLERIEHLVIERAEELDRSSWALLARADLLPSLRSLQLHHANAAQWIRANPALPKLEVLGLQSCALKLEDIKRLTRTPVWQTLDTVAVQLMPLFAEGAATIAAAPPARLRALDLSWCKLGPTGLRALTESSALKLEVLKLRHNSLSPAAAALLIEAPSMQGLEWLDVRGNALDAKTVAALKSRFPNVLA